MTGGIRLAGVAGVVLFLFGLVSYATTGAFDLWTVIHVAGGGVLLLVAAAMNLASLRQSVTSRGNRQRFGVVVGALLLATSLVAANVVAGRRPFRFDATENHIHTLSEKSRALLDGLTRPVELLAFLEPGDAARAELAELLDRFAARTPKLTWRVVDPEREPQTADQWGVRRKGVLAARSGEETAQAPGEIGALGEGEIASLILRVSHPVAKKTYVLTGHGEPALDDATTQGGLAALASALSAERFELEPLLLSTKPTIPEDARIVVVAGPRKTLMEHEVAELRRYIEKGGRALFLLNPGDAPELEPLLADWKLSLNDDMIVDQEEIPLFGARIGVNPIVHEFRPHAITRNFHERIVLVQARSVGIRTDGGLPGVSPQILAEASKSAWPEHDWRTMLSTGAVRRPASPPAAPVAVCAVSTRPATPEGAGEGRVVLIGDSDLAVNANLGAYFNQEFLVNSLQWLAGDEALIAEPPRVLRASRLDMTEADYRNLFRLSVLLLPEALLIVGLAIAWRRRGL